MSDSPAITSFTGSFRFLSNFYHAPVWLADTEYPTVEHAYQASKSVDPAYRKSVAACVTPAMAKAMGRRARLREDWDEIKPDMMYYLLEQKFKKEPLRSKLLATGDVELIEGNYWNDTYWGVCRGEGQNVLGRLLMEIRGELRYRRD